MVLQSIAAMFSGAARAAARGLQSVLLLFSPARRAARAASAKVLAGLSPAARTSMQAITKTIQPSLQGGLRYARNVTRQSVRTLNKKARFSQRVYQRSRRFWQWGKRRQGQITQRLRELQGDPQQAAMAQDEMQMLQQEQSAFEHLQADEMAVKQEFSRARDHDLKPLLRKANHAAKLSVLEDKEGAIDPAILEEYETTERALLEKMSGLEAYEQKVEQDEFAMMKLLLAALMRENEDLKKRLQQGSSRNRQEMQRRSNQILAELYMIQHTLHLAEREKLNEQILQQKARRIYALLEWLKRVRATEQTVLTKKAA